MKGLTKSVIFTEVQTGVNLTDVIKSHKFDIPNWVLTNDDVFDNMRFIEKKVVDPFKNTTLNALKNKDVVLVFNPEILGKLPRMIVYWSTLENNRLVTYVNMTHFAKRLQSGEFVCNNNLFYMLAQFGAIINRSSKSEFRNITNDVVLMENLASIYARTITQVLDRKFGLSSEPLLVSQVLYIFAKFFIVVLGEKANDTRSIMMARQAANELITDGIVNSIESFFEFDKITSMDDLLTKLNKFHPKIKDFTFRLLIKDYSVLYNSMSLMALENIPYIIFMLLSVVHLTGIHNEFRLEKLFQKNGIKAYNQLTLTTR